MRLFASARPSCAWYKLFEIRRLIFYVGNPSRSMPTIKRPGTNSRKLTFVDESPTTTIMRCLLLFLLMEVVTKSLQYTLPTGPQASVVLSRNL